MKILEIEVFGRGGLTHYVYNLARELGRRGHEVTIATAADYELDNRVADLPDTVRVERVLSRGASRLRGRLPYRVIRHLKGVEFLTDSMAVRRVVDRLDPDIVHVHCTNPIILWTMLLLRSVSCPVVYTAHDVTPHERVTLQDVLYRRIYGLSDHVVAHSERDRERLAEEFGLRGDLVSVIPHGDYGFFEGAEMGADRADARRRLGIEPDEEVALFFGFIREYKGLDLLLEAWPEVAAARPRARLVVAGDPARLDPARRQELSDRGSALGAIQRFAYIPFDEVSTYFAVADTLVLPYRNISQSGVLLLSLSVGVPVIATRVGAFPEVLTDEESALLIAPNSVPELQAALIRVLGDPDLRDRLAAEGVRVASAYSWPTIAERTDALFTRLRTGGAEPAMQRT